MNYPVRTKDTADHSGFDVQLDWLYKGKRRSKPKGLNALPIRKKPPTASSTPTPTITISGSNDTTTTSAPSTSAPVSKIRSRSKSISNGMLSESKTSSSEARYLEEERSYLSWENQ